ncbi:hypothetical protein BCR34DRAFT_605840 [Clohesyomyces aquaticus]|uniref:DUF6536 domain-containing protein n=1 Tax=Clohesyomyces aquaticus TaxID=1231657 RepID=A0A1Y1YUN0_9PLEO|nr:hypothetical protein BCR34DRAFT_605840 [Clohesyomyces aquaticus]
MRNASSHETEYSLLESTSNIELPTVHPSCQKRDDDGNFSKPLPTRPSWKAIGLADLRDGWRFSASLGVLLALCVLLLNIALTIWGAVRSSANNGHIYHGNCKTAKQINTGIHVIINVLSTLLLGASNYCMQCLCAPNRRDIDVAHREGRWLDVGVQSLRNLAYITPYKRWIWLLLGLSSLPLHLLFNSIFYSTLVNHDYDIYFASEDWLQGAWFDTHGLAAGGIHSMEYKSDPALFQSGVMNDDGSRFERLDVTECINAYANPYLSDRSNVALISKFMYNDTRIAQYYSFWDVASNSSLFRVMYSHDTAQPLYNYRDPYGWICDHYEGLSTGCRKEEGLTQAAKSNWTVMGYKVTGCVSQKVDELCSVNFTLAIGIVVILANVGKLICIVAVCFLLTDQPLLTLGDAVTSFLRSPDRFTKGICLWGKDDDRKHWRMLRHTGDVPAPRRFESKIQRRWRVAGKQSWAGFLFLYSTALLIALCLAIYGINKLKKYGQGSFSAIANLGIGTATTNTVIGGDGWHVAKSGNGAILANSLIANTPQLILSGVYLSLNNLLTRMQLAAEWSSYSVQRKALRVSHDRTGAQRGTYFLQLPYRLGLPLMAISATLHWLVSQSIFLASIDTWDSAGKPYVRESVATCGYSPLAIILTIIVGTVIVLFAIFVGMRRLEGAGMPVVGSHSVGIAAACHPPKDGGDENERLMWGEVNENIVEGGAQTVGHCSFASSVADVPVGGRMYA